MNVYGNALMDAKRQANGKVVSIALGLGPNGPTADSVNDGKLLVDLVAGGGLEPPTLAHEPKEISTFKNLQERGWLSKAL